MAYDELLKLLGTAGDPEADLSTTGSGVARFAGKNRSFNAFLRIGGDVTGTSPTLDMRIQESPDGTGSWVTIATFAQQIDEQVGYIATATPRYEVPGEDPVVRGFTLTKDYVRVDYTLGGTTPVFNDVSVELVIVKGAAPVRSGVL